MRLLTFSSEQDSIPRPGVFESGNVHALPFADTLKFLQAGPDAWQSAGGEHLADSGVPLADVQLHSPLEQPPSFRDFYAFEAHVKTSWSNRSKPVPAAWYEMPVFYFSNPSAMFATDAVVPIPAYSAAMDYELEIAAIIGLPGQDILAEKALDHIFGFTILNDWSARDEQRLEMQVALGPAKGKDFASSLGPWIVSPDEISAHATERLGVYDLEMTARVNGKERSRGNWQDLYYSFGEMIARASAGVTLHPGDVIGSGTVGTGCLLELTRGQGPWLQPDDIVELEIEKIGVLRNTVI